MKQISCPGCEFTPKNFFQALSLHYYTMAGTWEAKGSATEFDTDTYYRTLAAARRIDRIITGHSTVMDLYDPLRTVGLVLDEWGTWWDVEPGTNPGFLFQQNTLRDAWWPASTSTSSTSTPGAWSWPTSRRPSTSSRP